MTSLLSLTYADVPFSEKNSRLNLEVFQYVEVVLVSSLKQQESRGNLPQGKKEERRSIGLRET
jgi:hypothetical protein